MKAISAYSAEASDQRNENSYSSRTMVDGYYQQYRKETLENMRWLGESCAKMQFRKSI
jgi:hypothetical protein